MVEEQQHGFAFQKWVVEHAKHLYEIKTGESPEAEIGYTDEWDLPASLNPNSSDGPVSIKTAKWNSGIGFGDARRQFQIATHLLWLSVSGNVTAYAKRSSKLCLWS